jgi:circadian clock protein KaiB
MPRADRKGHWQRNRWGVRDRWAAAATADAEEIEETMKTTAHAKVDDQNELPEPGRLRLRLYISGATPSSTRALANIKAIAEKYLHGKYDLEVVDAYQQADLVRDQQILVLPTLVKNLPPPIRRLIGDLSDEKRVVLGLGIWPEGTGT